MVTNLILALVLCSAALSSAKRMHLGAASTSVVVGPHGAESPREVITRTSQRSWPTICPTWIEEYTALHEDIAQSGSAGKFMVYSCDEKTHWFCAGLGDRIRAMMETVKLAQYSHRAALFSWDMPAELEEVLQPASAQLDWRVKKQYKLEAVRNPVYLEWSIPGQPYVQNSTMPFGTPEELVHGTFAAEQSRLISISSNMFDSSGFLPGPRLGPYDSANRSCLFHALFKPSDGLVQEVQRMKRQLFGSVDVQYVAVHLRLGGFDGEWRSITRFEQLTGLLSVISCAHDLAAAHGITAPILFMTDNAMLRGHIQDGLLKGFVTTPYKATHIVHPKQGQGREALISSFTDLALLAQAACFIGSPSGFSWVAHIWGRHTCFLSLDKCMAAYEGVHT